MGGLGSGQHRWPKTRKVEDLLDFNINQFTRLTKGALGSCDYIWTRGAKITGDIRVLRNPEELIFSFSGLVNGVRENIQQTIKLIKMPCTFGGYRYWLMCPGCLRQCASVYSFTNYFKCRKCWGVAYSSQSETLEDRLLRKSRKIRASVGASINLSIPVYLKPKGMSERKFQWIRFKAIVVEQQRLSVLSNNFRSLDSRIMRRSKNNEI